MTTHKQVRSTEEALTALVHEMEYVLTCINEDKIPFDGDDFHEALRLGKEALAQPEQETVAIVDANDEGYWAEILPDRSVKVGQHLYAEAPQRKPMTDEQINMIAAQSQDGISPHDDTLRFARAIEDAHGIVGDTHE